MLRVVHVSKTFAAGPFSQKRISAVNDVSFHVPAKTSFGILGNSGCGKTTLARMMLGLIRPDSGHILVDGEDITARRSQLQRQRRTIQLLFQHPESALDPHLRIQDSLLEPLLAHRLAPDSETRQRKLEQVMALTRISTGLLGRYPHQISGGEAQRICIARVLLLEPKILVLDEPTSMLDVSVQAEIFALLRSLQSSLGLTYVLISHDLEIMRRFTDHLAVMQNGRFVEQGPPDFLFDCPRHPFTKELVENERFFSIASHRDASAAL